MTEEYAPHTHTHTHTHTHHLSVRVMKMQRNAEPHISEGTRRIVVEGPRAGQLVNVSPSITAGWQQQQHQWSQIQSESKHET